MSPTTTDHLRSAVEQAWRRLSDTDLPAKVTLERPKKAGFGDYSTNAAMLLAPRLQTPPRDVAQQFADHLGAILGSALEHAEVAGPGFLNLKLADAWFAEAVEDALAAGDAFGGGTAPAPERINVEFVSTNPTGPIHIGHARGAAYGDSLSRILGFHGHEVFREFYVNDAGSQVGKFGESIQARARGEEVAEDGYRGEYVVDVAQAIPDAATRPVEEVAHEGIERMLDLVRASLARFRVHHDLFFSELTLHEGAPSEVDKAFDVLREQGRMYEHEGALWVRTNDLGDDKDRVARRSNGELTYFASDIAYHWDKRERGFDRMIDVWGADHHGYVQRMKAAYAALGGDPAALELLIMQFVHLVAGGERASMSKRAGEFVTLDDLVDEVGVDAARWFLLQRSHDTTVEFDLDLAREQSSENPVYYVQYAHARIASLLEKAGAERVDAAVAAPPRPALEAAERSLILKILALPGEVAEASERRAPHRIATYALELAQEFTAFYRDCRVVGAEPRDSESFRLALCVLTQRTIARALDLLGVSAPTSM
jgi:arginyl-tRNA synthetase